MQLTNTGEKFTLGQLLYRLRQVYRPDSKALSKALHTSYTTYSNVERGNRELSFLMALRICRFYNLDLYEFISMLSDDELSRNDLSVIKFQHKMEQKKAALLKAKVIDSK